MVYDKKIVETVKMSICNYVYFLYADKMSDIVQCLKANIWTKIALTCLKITEYLVRGNLNNVRNADAIHYLTQRIKIIAH